MSGIVVIGAGAGGLAAAALLAAAGHEVTVCEQAPEVGGKLGWYERDGAGFDTGPSLLTLPAVLRDVFQATGGWPEGLSLRALTPLARYRFADGSGFDASSDLDTFTGALEAWSPGSGDDWRGIMAYAERLWEATHVPFLESELRGVGSLLRLAVRRPGDIVAVAPWRTLAALGERHLRDPRLRTFLWRYATYSGSDPRRAPAVLATVPYAEQHFGAWYVPGGLRRIALALRERATDLGAEVRTDAEVAQVLVRAGRAAGVRLATGEVLSADTVVANADAAHLYRDLLAGPAGARGRRRLARATASYSGLALLVGVRGPRPSALAHHTVVFPADYAAEFDDLAAGRPVRDPTLYVSAPDDGEVATGEVAPWFVLVNAPRHGPYDWADHPAAQAYADRLLDLLAERGLDVRNRVAFMQTRTPADLQAATRSPGGAIYGTSSDGPRAAFLRPANRSPLPGLYLVGGSSHPGGGLPLVLLSARIVAGIIG